MTNGVVGKMGRKTPAIASTRNACPASKKNSLTVFSIVSEAKYNPIRASYRAVWWCGGLGRRGSRFRARGTPVYTENLVRVDEVIESPKVARNDRAATFRSGHLDLAIQVQEPT